MRFPWIHPGIAFGTKPTEWVVSPGTVFLSDTSLEFWYLGRWHEADRNEMACAVGDRFGIGPIVAALFLFDTSGLFFNEYALQSPCHKIDI